MILEEHAQRLLVRRTGYVSAEKLKNANLQIHFRGKKTINGLQFTSSYI